MAAKRLVWVDLETTGLDPVNDLILEIGVIVTEGPNLEEVSAKSWVLARTPSQLERCNDWCKTQHKTSGLWDACLAIDATWTSKIEGVVIDYLRQYVGPDGEFGPMCGSTISFDRSFLKGAYPTLESKFHYRSLDVSAYRVHMPVLDMLLPAKAGTHRALDDLRDSIRLARYAGDCLLKGYEKAKETYASAPVCP